MPAALLTPPRAAPAAVVIVANRTEQPVRLSIQAPQGKPEEYSLEPGSLVPIPVTSAITLRFSSASDGQDHPLEPNAAYHIARSSSGLGLQQIIPGGGLEQAPGKEPFAARPAAKVTIPVKLLVDD